MDKFLVVNGISYLWQEAISNEYSQLERDKVFECIRNIPERPKAVGSKLVFREKPDGNEWSREHRETRRIHQVDVVGAHLWGDLDIHASSGRIKSKREGRKVLEVEEDSMGLSRLGGSGR